MATEIISISADCDSAVFAAIVGVLDSRAVEDNGEFLNAAMVVSGDCGGGGKDGPHNVRHNNKKKEIS